jgi:hypothetical protein
MTHVGVRPDASDFLAHFTSNGEVTGKEDPTNPAKTFVPMSAFDRLVSILNMKVVRASTLPWISPDRAVCFTECPWSSLLGHATEYSPYGVGFTKECVFAAGGGPVYYVRPDQWQAQKVWDPKVRPFTTPFSPKYRPASMKGGSTPIKKTVDYSHEREWRVPGDFVFELKQVKFVIVNTYEDVAAFPKPLKDAIGRDRFLIMDMYRTIERLWPVHNI